MDYVIQILLVVCLFLWMLTDFLRRTFAQVPSKSDRNEDENR